MLEALSPSHFRGVWASSAPRRFAPRGRTSPYSPEMTGGTYMYLVKGSACALFCSGKLACTFSLRTNASSSALSLHILASISSWFFLAPRSAKSTPDRQSAVLNDRWCIPSSLRREANDGRQRELARGLKNKLRMRVLCPAVRPFKKLPCPPDRGSSNLRETADRQISEKQGVIRILAPPNPAFFHQILEKKQWSKKSLLFHQIQNKALEDLW